MAITVFKKLVSPDVSLESSIQVCFWCYCQSVKKKLNSYVNRTIHKTVNFSQIYNYSTNFLQYDKCGEFTVLSTCCKSSLVICAWNRTPHCNQMAMFHTQRI